MRCCGVFRAGASAGKMSYPLVKELAADGIPVVVSCRVLKLSRQPYYRWLAHPITDREVDEAHRANALFDAHRDDPEFGHRLLADEAREAGQAMSDRTAWRITSANDWWCWTAWRWRSGRVAVRALPGSPDSRTTPSDQVLLPPLEPSVYTSIAFTDRLVDEGIDPSVGSVGDAYDNSLAESQIGLYKSELIHHEGPWRDVDQVEVATASWVQWFNTERTHRSIDDLTPIEAEQLDYALTEPLERAG